LSAAAVSQALRELEATMTTPLLTREAQGAVPTYAGRQLVVHARLILAQVGRPGHPFAHCTSFQELVDQDWVLTLRGEGQDQPLIDLLAPYGISPPPHRVHYARSGLVAISMLEVGDMLTICPWPLLETPMLRGRVQALPIREQLPEMRTSIVVRRNDTLSAAGQLFIDCFEEATRNCVHTEDPAMKRIMNSVELMPAA